MKSNPKIIKMIIIFIFVIINVTIFCRWQNNGVGITNYNYTNSKIPKGFDGYKIVQISDLHNKDFNGILSEKIRKVNPDIIVITGDLIDRRNTQIDIAIEFIEEINRIAPIYYVSGNHEQLFAEYNTLQEELKSLNVQIIDNSYIELNEGTYEIGLMGIADPAIQQDEHTYLWSDDTQYIKNNLKKLTEDINTDFNILLSHRPEQFSIYQKSGVDLIFSGHAHGGQIRLPIIGGLVAPGQGLFPKHTSGIHSDGETSMVVSRGLGNSIFPLRIFNRPEIIVVNLHS